MEEFGRRRRVALDGHEMWMVAPEDLILSKRMWRQASNSEVQARDVRAVTAAGTRTSDTTPGVDAAFAAMLASLTPTERVRMMSGMFDTARRILMSNIRAMHPDISDVELRVQVFLRTYHDDYTPADRDCIVAFIRQRG